MTDCRTSTFLRSQEHWRVLALGSSHALGPHRDDAPAPFEACDVLACAADMERSCPATVEDNYCGAHWHSADGITPGPSLLDQLPVLSRLDLPVEGGANRHSPG